MECAAIQDVLVVSGGIEDATSDRGKGSLTRIVSMLTRLALRAERLSESRMWFAAAVDYEHDYEHEHEHRFAEHE